MFLQQEILIVIRQKKKQQIRKDIQHFHSHEYANQSVKIGVISSVKTNEKRLFSWWFRAENKIKLLELSGMLKAFHSAIAFFETKPS